MTNRITAPTAARVLFVLAIAAFVGIVSALVDSQLSHPVPRVSAEPGIYVELNGDSGTFTFAPALCDEDNMSPLNSRCATQLLIANVGDELSSPAFYTIVAWADANGDQDGPPGPDGDATSACFNVNLLLGTADGANVGTSAVDGPLPGPELAVGAVHSWGLEASVTPDNVCQAAQATIIVTVQSVGDETELPVVDEEPPFDNEPQATGPATTTTTLTDQVLGVQTTATGTDGQPTLVNEILGVQRLPSTGSGGLLGEGSASRAGLHAAIACLVAGAAVSLLSALGSRRKRS